MSRRARTCACYCMYEDDITCTPLCQRSPGLRARGYLCARSHGGASMGLGADVGMVFEREPVTVLCVTLDIVHTGLKS